MNWLKSTQKSTLVASLVFLLALTTLVGFLVGVPVRTLVASHVGGLAGVALVPLMLWAVKRDIARLAALEKKEKDEPGLILPPGMWLRNVLHTIYPPKTAERVFDPILADMQLEWQEAMLHDRKWLANWIQVRGVLTILLTVLAQAVTALGSIFKLVK